MGLRRLSLRLGGVRCVEEELIESVRLPKKFGSSDCNSDQDHVNL